MTSNSSASSADGSSGKPNRTQAYLQRTLSMNPIWEADHILSLRRKAFRIPMAVAERKVATNSSDDQSRREAMRRAVDKIQHEFWTLPLEELQRRIGAIDVKDAPDLSGVLQRLRTTAICRAEFPKLASSPGMHLPLFHAFKTAVVLPPNEAGYVREQFLRSIDDRKELKRIKKSIAVIQRDYSVLFALEKDWFKMIRDLKKPPRERVVTEPSFSSWFDFEGFELGWPAVFVLGFFIRILLRLASSSE